MDIFAGYLFFGLSALIAIESLRSKSLPILLIGGMVSGGCLALGEIIITSQGA